MKNSRVLIIGVIVIGLGGLILFSRNNPDIDDIETEVVHTVPPTTQPKKVSLSVPFQVQAPNANWDALHEDACEEASLIMVKNYKNKTPLANGEEDIQRLIAYETSMGLGYSVTVAELKGVADWYGLAGGRIVKNPTVAQIKAELIADRPVIIPAAGRMLGNPNFSGEGPVYHMLVVTGYTKSTFITNDPGTRNGERYEYKTDTLMKAIHDWDPNDISKGTPAYLVFDR